MAKPTLLTEEEAQDLLNDGVSYISYWANVTHYVPDVNGNVKLIRFFDHAEMNQEYTITIQDIREAAYRVVNEKLANNSVICDIAQGDYDATSADVVIQVAALGEVVYG